MEGHTRGLLSMNKLILRVDCGSRGFGLNSPTSDHDHKGVFIETFLEHVRLESPLDQQGPTKVLDDPLYPEGLDFESYSLKKFLNLAIKGNPNILCIGFSTNPIEITPEGRELQSWMQWCVSKKACAAFLGYMQGQKERALNRGRPAYVEKYGYDTKFVMHLVRIGLQGVELMETGRITLPVPERYRADLLSIREGKVTMEWGMAWAAHLEERLKELKTSSPLPDEPDRDLIEKEMSDMYKVSWVLRC